MSETKHTSGEWKVGYQALSVETPEMKICDIRGWGHLTGNGIYALGLPFEEAKAIQVANAHLIAAAPELLAACQMAYEYFDKCVITHDEDAEGEQDYPEILALRAAIAKAEGREPSKEETVDTL